MTVSPPQEFYVGQEEFLGYNSPNDSVDFGVVFEDNGSTGYFYAINKDNGGMDILDALHIYNVKDVIDKEKVCEAEFMWSEDGLKSALMVNGYCHAIFDFKQKAGFCRNAFPEANHKWSEVKDRKLTDELVEAFFAKKE